MIGQDDGKAAGRGVFVEPVPSVARQLELDGEVQRHAVGHHVDEPGTELDGEVDVEREAAFGRAQGKVAHLDAVGARHGDTGGENQAGER